MKKLFIVLLICLLVPMFFGGATYKITIYTIDVTKTAKTKTMDLPKKFSTFVPVYTNQYTNGSASITADNNGFGYEKKVIDDMEKELKKSTPEVFYQVVEVHTMTVTPTRTKTP